MNTLYTLIFFLAGTGLGLYLAGWCYVEKFYAWKARRRLSAQERRWK